MRIVSTITIHANNLGTEEIKTAANYLADALAEIKKDHPDVVVNIEATFH
jgi:hypothetical protein